MTIQVRSTHYPISMPICQYCSTHSLYSNQAVDYLSLSPIPSVDAFQRTLENAKKLPLYDIGIYRCCKCGLVQVTSSPSNSVFYDNYIYSSSSSPDMRSNFVDLVQTISKFLPHKESFSVLDIGCNDGLLLGIFHEMFPKASLHGTDPSPIAKQNPHRIEHIYNEYFPGPLTQTGAPYDVIVGTNSLAHIPEIGKVFSSVIDHLAEGGLFVMEVSNIDDMAAIGAWDYIYHEHLYYYDKRFLFNLCHDLNLEILCLDPIPTKGGSLRLIARNNPAAVSHSQFTTCNPFITQVEPIESLSLSYTASLEHYDELLSSLPEDKHIYGYGACATSTVTISQHKLFDRLSFVFDDNPARQGLFSPYHGIPTAPVNSISFKEGDIIIVFAWRFQHMITQRVISYCQDRLMPVPTIIPSISSKSPILLANNV
jgi:SAM-dependent methyltransferase